MPPIYKQLAISLLATAAFSFSTLTNANLLEDGRLKYVDVTTNTDTTTAFKDACTKLFDAKSALKLNTNQIAIGAFQVEYVTTQIGDKCDDACSTHVTKKFVLKNLDQSKLQGMTDKLYTSLVATLSDKGYQVFPQDALQKTALKTEIDKATKAGPVKKPAGSSDGFFKNFGAGQETRDLIDESLSYTATNTAATPTSPMAITGFYSYARELNVPIVLVKLRVNFVKIDSQPRFSLMNVTGVPQNVVSIEDSGIHIVSPNTASGMFPLVKSLALPGKVTETVTEITDPNAVTSTAGKGILNGTLAIVKGGGLFNILAGAAGAAEGAAKSGTFEVLAGSDYEDKVLPDLQLALKILAESITKAK